MFDKTTATGVAIDQRFLEAIKSVSKNIAFGTHVQLRKGIFFKMKCNNQIVMISSDWICKALYQEEKIWMKRNSSAGY